MGALIDGSIGAATLVLAICLFAFFYFRHRRRRNKEPLRSSTSITARPYMPPHSASPTLPTRSNSSSSSKLVTMRTDLPAMPPPPLVDADVPVMPGTLSAHAFVVGRKPVPTVESLNSDQGVSNPTLSSPTHFNYMYIYPMAANDPFAADPVSHKPDDPLLAVSVVSTAPMSDKERGTASASTPDLTFREVCSVSSDANCGSNYFFLFSYPLWPLASMVWRCKNSGVRVASERVLVYLSGLFFFAPPGLNSAQCIIFTDGRTS